MILSANKTILNTLLVLHVRLTKIFAFSSKYHLTALSSSINSSYSPAFLMHLLYIIPEISDYSLLYLIKFCNTISITCLFWTVPKYLLSGCSCSILFSMLPAVLIISVGQVHRRKDSITPEWQKAKQRVLTTGQHCAAPHSARTSSRTHATPQKSRLDAKGQINHLCY